MHPLREVVSASFFFADRRLQLCVKNRLGTTWIVVAMLILLDLLTGRYWNKDGLMEATLQTAGLLLVTVSAFGRLWSMMYIAGYKKKTLVTSGPYSMVRNPLYLFSFIGVVGAGFATESLLITTALICAFTALYPRVVREEEKALEVRYGEEYVRYSRRTPKFIPKRSLLYDPETYTVNSRSFRRAFMDAACFLGVYGLLQIVEKAHHWEVFPTLFKIF